MAILRHELRQGRRALAVWTVSIALMMMACVFLYPEVRGEMGALGTLFAAMGSFTAAFGMDRLNIGTLAGFYGIECGNILGLGGAFFAALTGATLLSKEEGGGTAEFLLAHPISQARVVTEKLAAEMAQLTLLNAVALGLSLLAVRAIGETIPWRELLPLHLGCFLLQVEIAAICLGISAFLRRGGAGIGLGLAALLYCLNLIANMSAGARFLKYLTPFAYCEAADIASAGGLDPALLAIGLLVAAIGVATAYLRYCTKDLR